MKNLLKIVTLSLFTLSFSISAQQSSDNRTGFISDDLFIYFHSGAGTEYRILGSISAGEEVQVLSKVENGYIHVMDPNNRKGWIDANYLSEQPGLRVVLAELNEDLTDKTVQISTLRDNLSATSSELIKTKQQLATVNNEKQKIEKLYADAESDLDAQSFEIKKTWFIYGASVLIIGLFLGLIIPKFAKKRSSSSWN
ncbi:TIGR04211 family SH3 domain-containing protein [Colwelliaceae bacterium BS250]